jgi:sulfur carrier protein
MHSAVNAGLVVNGSPRPLPADPTVAGLLTELGLSNAPCAVELNRVVVPRREHPATPLAEGDQVEIVTLVGGG